MLIAARRMLLPGQGLVAGWVRVGGETIAEVGLGHPPDGAAPDETVDVLAPGFVDIHCHGGAGHSFATTDPDVALTAARAHRAHGTTSVVASLVTDRLSVLGDQVEVLASLVNDGELAGIHLEGPWLSPAFNGAHDAALLRTPERGDVDALLDRAAGAIRMVTLAPELPGAMDAVRQLAGEGVAVAAGHTDADAVLMAEAIDAGVTVMTHLFNAMRPIHHRAPGPAPVALADRRVLVELIADAVHLHPAVLAMAARAATGGFALVSDAMAGALAPDGRYLLGGQQVVVSDGVPRLTTTGGIAGSTLTLLRAVQVMAAAGVPLEVVLTGASTAPAERLGLVGAGRILPGRRADLVALTDALEPTFVLFAGSRMIPGA